jgi:hypothetical protein
MRRLRRRLPGAADAIRSEAAIMRCTFIPPRLRHITSLLVAALALALPCAAEARSGGGGGGGFGIGFSSSGMGLGARAGSFGRGGFVARPGGVVVFRTAPRGGRHFVRGRHLRHDRGIFLRRSVRPFPAARRAAPFIPPFAPVVTGVVVSPLVVVPPVIGTVVTPPPGVAFQPITGIPTHRPAVANDLGLWRNRTQMPPPVAMWRRDENGTWRAASAD